MKPLRFTIVTPLVVLPLHYALQDAGLPCTVTQPTLETLHCLPLDIRGGKDDGVSLTLTEFEQRLKIDAFVKGWIACLTQIPLNPDHPLTVSRVPKQNLQDHFKDA